MVHSQGFAAYIIMIIVFIVGSADTASAFTMGWMGYSFVNHEPYSSSLEMLIMSATPTLYPHSVRLLKALLDKRGLYTCFMQRCTYCNSLSHHHPLRFLLSFYKPLALSQPVAIKTVRKYSVKAMAVQKKKMMMMM